MSRSRGLAHVGTRVLCFSEPRDVGLDDSGATGL